MCSQAVFHKLDSWEEMMVTSTRLKYWLPWVVSCVICLLCHHVYKINPSVLSVIEERHMFEVLPAQLAPSRGHFSLSLFSCVAAVLAQTQA